MLMTMSDFSGSHMYSLMWLKLAFIRSQFWTCDSEKIWYCSGKSQETLPGSQNLLDGFFQKQ